MNELLGVKTTSVTTSSTKSSVSTSTSTSNISTTSFNVPKPSIFASIVNQNTNTLNPTSILRNQQSSISSSYNK